jgi:hypothetical protein|tara:strand:- start:1032 stop:1562 length:531 start_codon:yes stop_codon:yes gene_type:complete
MSEWLPDNYEIPSEPPKYLRWGQGDNVFRVMTRPIVGYEWWEDKTPNRVKVKADVPKEVWNNGQAPKHFWAMVVYNPADDCFQVCEITQKTIQEAVKSLASDPDWGDPTGYDIVVTRKGEDLNTEYTIRAKPKKALPDVVKKRYKEFHCDLDALYKGDDPFAVEVADAETEEELPF